MVEFDKRDLEYLLNDLYALKGLLLEVQSEQHSKKLREGIHDLENIIREVRSHG